MRYKIRIRIVKVKNNEIRFVARIHNNTKNRTKEEVYVQLYHSTARQIFAFSLFCL